MNKVRRRVEEYELPRDEWLRGAFLPVMDGPMVIECLAWEDVIEYISSTDRQSGEAIGQFYQHCRDFR